MNDTLSLCVADAYVRVTEQTFGHLKPKPQTEYKGFILFTLTAFGDTCLIDFEFENITESPWFNNDILDHISDFTEELPKDKHYGVYKWSGTYKKFKNSNFKFKGKFLEINTNTTVE